MWADPEWRETIRGINEWPWFWEFYLFYSLCIFVLWLIWMNRPWPEDPVMNQNIQNLQQAINQAEQGGGGNSAAFRVSP